MKPLSGLRLLDLTHIVSGPYAAMMLTDLGMETIKVEPPGRGEATRRLLEDDPAMSLHGMGAYFITLNRGKKSLTLDLKSEVGRAIFYDLVRVSDVVLDNFSAGVTARLGIDHTRLGQINPRILTASITGFGESGSESDLPAFDMVVQALGGLMSVTGHPNGPPVRAGVPVADLASGLMAAIGILSALLARQQTGQGQHVEIAMLDAQISLLNYMVTMQTMSGIIPTLMGNAHTVHVPYDAYPTSDGWIVLALVGDEFWKPLMSVMQIAALDTEENMSSGGRQRNRDEITRLLAEKFRTDTQDRWLERLRAARVPCAPVNNLAQALADPLVISRDMVVEVEHPHGGTAHIPGNPIKLSDAAQDYGSPPTQGQHTDEILRDLLHRSIGEIDALRSAGII